jgi:hypothetical protein
MDKMKKEVLICGTCKQVIKDGKKHHCEDVSSGKRNEYYIDDKLKTNYFLSFLKK